jgi:prepilin peptidase CpaA
MTAQLWIAIAVGLAASIEDIWRREISNLIPAAALLAGVGLHSAQRGWAGCGMALLGCLAGFGVFLVFYLLGGMGGGDIKLMAGFGALLGAAALVEAALWTAGLGGLQALAVIGWQRLRRRGAGAGSIPYAPVISVGAWLALWAH